FYTGNTIFLEHGNGLYTTYAHLSEISVEVGETIQQGSIIGLIGILPYSQKVILE
ncbi:MAG: M23 family metallopeptidase, partial [Alphaproteobacteria bacterium]|nr:M23 family metallopeptidase [Alphaproteobacteria bacterium]